MKKRLCKAILTAVLSASILCGCFDNTQNKPISLDPGSSVTASSDTQSVSSSRSSDTSQTVQPRPASSSSTGGLDASSDTVTESRPQSQTASEDGQEPSVISEPEPSYSSEPEPSVISEPKPPYSSEPEPSYSSDTELSVGSGSTSSSSSTSQSVDPPITSSENGSILYDYTSKWAYNQITEKQRQAYSRLYSSAYNVTRSCDISDLGLTSKDIESAYWAFDYDNPQFLELGSGCKFSYYDTSDGASYVDIYIEYGRASGAVPQGEFNRITQNVLANAQAMPSDYEKLKYVHDWIVNNTVYINANTHYESEADGPVVYGKAICEGYSKAFMYFAQSMGFECVCVVGHAGGVDHMWNMVKLYGQWYHVDATWDDPVMSDGSQMLRHTYFLISDSRIGQDHSIRSPFTLPSAPYSYA